jgi:replicative DNA helicase
VNLVQDIIDANKSVVVFSTEMSSEQYMQRLMAITAGIPTRVLRQGGMTLDQSANYKIARDLWTSARILFYDDLYTLPRIRRAAKKAKEKMGIDVIIVDFIQNLSETGDEVKDARLAAIQLQAMAKELDVCVVALSQISNAMAQQQSEGTMGLTNYYAFKGSGAIKDAADVAIMLDRDRVNNPEVLWLNVVKNRHDSIDRIGAKFFLDYGGILPMTTEEQTMADPNAGRKPRKESGNAGE